MTRSQTVFDVVDGLLRHNERSQLRAELVRHAALVEREVEARGQGERLGGIVLQARRQPGTVRQRGAFATKHLWVSAYDPAHKYASGDYPNQHEGGAGLPAFIADNKGIENGDLVLWHSFGHTHVCKPEDFPVMPVEYAGFSLKPNNFFAANPAMDLPGGKDAHSVQDGDAPSCCA